MLNSDDISRRIQALTTPGERLFRSLGEIAEHERPTQGIQTGLNGIDSLTGGLQPGRLNTFVGYTSHGKTTGMLTTICNNIDAGLKMLLVSGDDTDDDILFKLLAMRHQMSPEDVSVKGKRWRRDAVAELEGQVVIAGAGTSAWNVDSLALVIEDFKECTGAYPDLVGYDYLTTLSFPGQAGEPYAVVPKQARAIKDLIRAYRHTTFMVGHQCNRGIVSGNVTALLTRHVEYGGVQETDGVMIGFRRKLDTEDLSDEQIEEEGRYPTVNVSVMKNKVTGKRSPNPAGFLYSIDPISGIIRERTIDELRAKPRTLQAVKLRNATVNDRYTDDSE